MNKGLIKISNEIYCNQWDLISIIFESFRPINIEFRHWENNIWYLWGISEKFRKLDEGEKIPEYEVIFTFNKKWQNTYEFNELK